MTVLARRGAGGYRQYRIPALAVAGQTVLCAYDGRPDLDDLPAPIDLLLRRSEDGGRTWFDQEVVRSGEGFQGFGDPSLLVDPATGAVLLFHAAGEHAGFFESGDGEDADDPGLQHCDLSVSTDVGRTWSHRRLTSQLRSSGNSRLGRTGNSRPGRERIAGMFASSGAGCAITAGPYRGRLVQPFVLRIAGRIDVACALSDDHGATWRLSAPIGGGHTPEVELNESSVCMLPGGELLLHSRGIGCRWAAWSHDGGETFSRPVPVPELLDPSVNGSVIAGGGGAGRDAVAGELLGDVLLASHCADAQLRRHAQISRSDDGGASWRRWHLVEPGSAGYTQLAELPDGRIGIAYEANGYQEIRFEAFDAPDGTDGLRPASAEAGSDGVVSRGADAPGWVRTCGAGVVLDVVLRSVVPARPEHWLETGPTHEIDLGAFEGVDPAVFKEIGQGRGSEAIQVLRTRESLTANLGPIRPGIHAGDRLEVHAHVRAEHESAGCAGGVRSLQVRWADQERRLAPGESWLRRDLEHVMTTSDTAQGFAEVSCAVVVDRTKLRAHLRVPT